MTIRAITFAISELSTGRGLAHGLIAPTARYASVAWLGADRLDRRIVPPAEWKQVEFALAEQLPATPFESTSVFVRSLLDRDRRTLTVQYVADTSIRIGSPAMTVTKLDAALRALAATGGTE